MGSPPPYFFFWFGLVWLKLWPVLVYRFTAVYWVITSPAGPTGLASGHTLSNKKPYPLHDRFASNNYILYQLQQLHWRQITASREIGGQEINNLAAWQIQLASWRTRPVPSTCRDVASRDLWYFLDLVLFFAVKLTLGFKCSQRLGFAQF